MGLESTEGSKVGKDPMGHDLAVARVQRDERAGLRAGDPLVGPLREAVAELARDLDRLRAELAALDLVGEVLGLLDADLLGVEDDLGVHLPLDRGILVADDRHVGLLRRLEEAGAEVGVSGHDDEGLGARRDRGIRLRELGVGVAVGVDELHLMLGSRAFIAFSKAGPSCWM